MKIVTLLIIAFLSLCSTSSFAQQSNAGQACRADVQKLCPGISPGGGKIKDCLVTHASELSDTCQAALKKSAGGAGAGAGGAGAGAAGAGAMAGASACEADTKAYCKGVQPGSGRVVDCLIDHQKDISDACYNVLIKRQDAMDATSAKNAK